MKRQITVYGCAPEEASMFERMSPRYGWVPVITGQALSEQNAGLARGSIRVSVGHQAKVTKPMLCALRRAGIEVLSTRSIGTDHIDLAAAQALGIAVRNTPYAPDGVADHTVMLMLMAIRKAGEALQRGAGSNYSLTGLRGRALCDLTVGVIGTGRIGSAVMRRLHGFGCNILTYDHRPKSAANDVSLPVLLKRSDVVTLHTPLCKDTYHLLDHARIGAMKRGAVIVNTARGALIDTGALLCALEEGRLGGAALDVVEGEEGIFYSEHTDASVEYQTFRRLCGLPNVTITPHMAYYTADVLRDTVQKTLEVFPRGITGVPAVPLIKTPQLQDTRRREQCIR